MQQYHLLRRHEYLHVACVPVFVKSVVHSSAILVLKKMNAHRNKVEANHVFLLEPLLNAAVEAQAVNRVHRGGQTRATTIHRFVVRGTIEEDIERWVNEACVLLCSKMWCDSSGASSYRARGEGRKPLICDYLLSRSPFCEIRACLRCFRVNGRRYPRLWPVT